MSTPNTVVVTSAYIGPGLTAASLTIQDVRSVNFNLSAQVVEVNTEDGNVRQFQYSNIDTVTFAFPGTTGQYGTTITIEKA